MKTYLRSEKRRFWANVTFLAMTLAILASAGFAFQAGWTVLGVSLVANAGLVMKEIE